MLRFDRLGETEPPSNTCCQRERGLQDTNSYPKENSKKCYYNNAKNLLIYSLILSYILPKNLGHYIRYLINCIEISEGWRWQGKNQWENAKMLLNK